MWGGVEWGDGSIKSLPTTPMWNSATPSSVQVVGCRRPRSVASSCSSRAEKEEQHTKTWSTSRNSTIPHPSGRRLLFSPLLQAKVSFSAYRLPHVRLPPRPAPEIRTCGHLHGFAHTHTLSTFLSSKKILFYFLNCRIGFFLFRFPHFCGE